MPPIDLHALAGLPPAVVARSARTRGVERLAPTDRAGGA